MKYTIILFLTSATLLLGCRDASVSAHKNMVEGREKSAVTNERLPENDFEAALSNHGIERLLAWAEDGDRKAQFFVALAYMDGGTVPKNFEITEKWALRAANQGAPAAQYFEGILRQDAALGENLLLLEPNMILAYMWFSLAAAQDHRLARQERDKIQKTMDPLWVARSQALAAAWRVCNQRACWDLEPNLGPPSHCSENSKSILCLTGDMHSRPR